MTKKYLYIRFFEHRDLVKPTEQYPLTPMEKFKTIDPCDTGVNIEMRGWLERHPEGKIDFTIQ